MRSYQYCVRHDSMSKADLHIMHFMFQKLAVFLPSVQIFPYTITNTDMYMYLQSKVNTSSGTKVMPPIFSQTT
jgi:hypothetical protein